MLEQSIDQYRLSPEKLNRRCSLDKELDFCRSSLDAPPLSGVIGQDRAVRAMRFGLDMDVQGYHIFVVGPPGTGKNSYVQTMVSEAAKKGPVAPDWCYIHNFADPDQPQAVCLSAGKGRVFKQDMAELIVDLRTSIPKAFTGSDFEQQKETIVEQLQERMQNGLNQLKKEAIANDFEVKQIPGKILFAPRKADQTLTPEEFNQLSEDEQLQYQERGHKLEKQLEELMHQGRLQEKQAREKIIQLEKQISRDAAVPLISKLQEKYADHQQISAYLEGLLTDVEEEHHRFKEKEGTDEEQALPWARKPDGEEVFWRYQVNLFVSNEKMKEAPVVTESFLHYYNLFGKIEYRSQMMELMTHFTMAKAGALHRANGGYLILQAKDVLTEPFVWSTLKRALKYQSAVLENIGEQYRYVPMVTMRMQPIPLDVKVILIGTPMFYHILSLDEDFQKLFKVKVEFDTEMQRSQDNLRKYASFVQSMCQNENLLPFSQKGLARVVEYGSRLAGHQNKLSTRFNEVSEIVYEAHALAQKSGAAYVEAEHVQSSILEQKYRNNRIEEKIQDLIAENKILIDTRGQVIGQINGLSVISLGYYQFGQPSRITAVTYMGHGGVINIERETEMSGQLHSKGVLTMSGYLGATFAQDFPLSLTAQITFEQNYQGVDGDSASCAELYAILSSLADLPIRQNIAVTGSVNQLGQIQPIGGVTEKVEGFFDVCKAQGLTGDQGVIVPRQNVDQLMLKQEIVEAVEDGQFNLYAIDKIEQGLVILTGHPVGEKDEQGQYPDDSAYGRIMRKLHRFQEKQVPNHETTQVK